MSNAFGGDQDSRFSTLREQMLEHMFIAELMQEVWFGRKQPIEVLRSEVDSFGYDLVLDCNGVVRHIQLKSSTNPQPPSVSLELQAKPSGCVVLMEMDHDGKARKAVIKYRFFGGAPGQPLPIIEKFPNTKQTRRNIDRVRQERPGHHRVPLRAFDMVASIQVLADKLFGSAEK